jgi:hypothetical protein
MGSSLWHLAAFKGINDKEHFRSPIHLYLFIHQPKWVSRVRSSHLEIMGASGEVVLSRKGEESRGNYGFNGVLVEYWTSKGQHLSKDGRITEGMDERFGCLLEMA